MKYMLSLCLLLTSFTLLVDDDNAGQELQGRHLDFGIGYTTVTYLDNKVKITAEQRMSDNKIQVIVFPLEMGVTFNLEHLRVGHAPPRYNLQGKVVLVKGNFVARVSENGPKRRQMTVPVQISRVNQFTVSSNEALIQGNQYREFTPQ
ncbi:MAG: hypothetical protein JSR37_00255 [Verrucomicrobia bacterium]|nr:hypothetical protein [Verrucomicrobiota bacterium]